jgi:hypothetical protein
LTFSRRPFSTMIVRSPKAPVTIAAITSSISYQPMLVVILTLRYIVTP